MKHATATATVLALLATAVPARADTDLMTVQIMSPELALELATATMRYCRDQGYQVSVAVVDRFGGVQVVLRDRLAGFSTPEVARRKARTAAGFRTDTLGLAAATGPDTEVSGIRFAEDTMMVGGGVPVEAAGSVVGAVGVSGAPGGAADDSCARAGVAAIAERLAF